MNFSVTGRKLAHRHETFPACKSRTNFCRIRRSESTHRGAFTQRYPLEAADIHASLPATSIDQTSPRRASN
jgi:hypothetical protein